MNSMDLQGHYRPSSVPDIPGHNVETVARLQKSIRRRARYDRSLAVLTAAKALAARCGAAMDSRTSLIGGLGKTMANPPSRCVNADATGVGFRHVESVALVRWSYNTRDRIPGGSSATSLTGSSR